MFLVLWLASWGSSRILFSSLDLRPFLLLITVVGIEVVFFLFVGDVCYTVIFDKHARGYFE